MADLSLADRLVMRTLRPLPAREFTYLTYLWRFRSWPNLRKPTTFNEHIQAHKLFDRDPLLTLTADKYAVRDYVANRIGEQYLVPMLQYARHPEDLNLADLPQSFVLKATHGNSATLIVRDKSTADWEQAVNTMNAWLKTNWYKFNKEWAYQAIPPGLIVERFLDDDGAPPPDYKFFVINHRIRLVQVDVGRFGDHQRILLSPSWRPLAVQYGFPRPGSIERPPHLGEMLRIAEELSADFPIVRVDLYDHQGQVLFGELTHYPEAGTVPFIPHMFDQLLGDMWTSDREIPAHYFL